MQAKTLELEGQLKTLEMLLANYEIQHVVGEIDDEIYTREINLLTTSLDTTKNELGTIRDAASQLFSSPKPIEAPVAAEPVAAYPHPYNQPLLKFRLKLPQSNPKSWKQ